MSFNKADKGSEVKSVTVQSESTGLYRRLLWLAASLSILLIFSFLWLRVPAFKLYIEGVDSHFYYFLGAGFVFAMIDGAIGMSYGVTSTTFAISM